jgi:hypothetical protein
MTAQPAELASGRRVRVAGDPTPAQLAALLLALDQAIAVDVVAATAAAAAPAWARAARLEALGHRPLAAPADLADLVNRVHPGGGG